jgi:hypothetical protein
MTKNIVNNINGFAHDLIAVAIVAVVAIGGAGYLVASHAASCAGSCTNAVTSTGSCSISKVPAKVLPGVLVSPAIHVKNTGTSTFTTTVNIIMSEYGKGGGSQATFTVKPGKTDTASNVGSIADGTVGGKINITATSANPAFTCTAESIVK